MISDWVAKEMQTVDVGDKRLAEVLSMFVATPSKSIPASVGGGHNETTAAYRLFDNDALGFENILQPHIDATYEHLAEQVQPFWRTPSSARRVHS
jgi:hypothetical protein